MSNLITHQQFHEINNVDCILVKFNDADLLEIGYLSWLDDLYVAEIDKIIAKGNEITISWPNCKVTAATSKFKFKLQTASFKTRVIKVLATGSWQSMREKQQNFTKYKKLDISKADRKTVSKKRKDDEDDEKDTSVNISSKKIKRSELQKESENILMSTINKRTTNHPDISKIYSSNDELSTEEELSDDSENFTLRLSSLSDFNKQDSSILNLNKEINLNDIKKKLEQKDIEIAELKENLKHGIIEKERTEVELCSIKLDLETLKKKEQDVNNCTYTVNSAKNDLLKIKNLIERTINKLNGDEDLKQENENSQILLNIKEEKGKDDDKQQTFTLKASILGNCRKDTIENYAADLIDNCFVDTEFMNSSVTGKKCNANKEDDISDPKPALDSAKMNFIEKLVFKQFGTTRKVRSRIRKVASNKISQRRSNIN